MTKENRLKTHQHCLKLKIKSPYAKEFKEVKEKDDGRSS